MGGFFCDAMLKNVREITRKVVMHFLTFLKSYHVYEDMLIFQ